MGAAFLARGETLVDPITISLVGDDEDAAFGRCSRSERNKGTGQNCGYRSHAAPGNERIALIDKLKKLRMINLGRGGPRSLTKQALVSPLTQSP